MQGTERIKKEIYQNGPVLGLIHAYREFLTYHKGVFNFNATPFVNGYQVVKIVGWGKHEVDGETTSFWLVENMWGKDWGQDGLAEVEMGNKDSMIDKFTVALYPEKQ